MTIFSIFTLLGGLAFFLYGMNVMSGGLEKLAGSRLETALKRMTSNAFASLALGAGITIAIQSSSALTVMLVGLVNSGIMDISQTVGVIMGSNIGTTLTAWILSLSGIDSKNIFINLLKPENFSPLIALAGILLSMLSKKDSKKSIGNICLGFAVLMFGMELMKDSMAPLADSPEFASILTAFNNPVLGVLVGALFTGIIQSSAASVGILQALSLTGGISYGMAIPIIMGQNIGTCVTALISSIGVSKNAKKVAAIHLSFNIIGTALCLVLFYGIHAIFPFEFIDANVEPWGIALVHTIFNVFVTVVLMPFSKQLVKLANMLVRGKDKTEQCRFLDERLLSTPSFAASECNNLTVKMANLAQSTLLSSIEMIENYAAKEADAIRDAEDYLDRYEDELGTYLVKLSGKELSDADSRKVSKLLHTIGDFERLGDHALNLLDGAEEIHNKQIHFSGDAQRELGVLSTAIRDIMTLTVDAFVNDDIEKAKRVEPLEQIVDLLSADIKARHIERLRAGNCTIELGFILSDMLNNYERISDHCSNIAVAIIELGHDSFQTHEYLNAVKTDDSEFNALFAEYQTQYQL